MGPALVLRVVVASFGANSGIGDDVADRLALAECAVVAREHVGDAGSGSDAARLQALGKRLGADVVLGDGVILEVSTGVVTPLKEKTAAALAQAFIEKKKLTLSDAAKSVVARADSARALVTQASAAIAGRDYAHARELAQKAVAAAPGARGPLLMLARADDYADRDDAAIAGYRAVLEVAKHDAIAHNNLARLLAKKHDPAAAAEYRAAVAAEPAWSVPAYNLALVDLASDRAAAAVETLERLHAAEPDRGELTVGLARALRRADRPGAALPLVEPFLAAHPTDNGARAELALSLGASGRIDDGLKLAEGAAPLVVAARAQLLLMKGAPDEAAQLLEGKSGDRLWQETLAVARLRQKRVGEALSLLQSLIDVDGGDAELLCDFALAAIAQGDPVRAKNALLKAQSLAPTHAQVALALAGLVPEKAQATLEAATAAHSGDGRLQLALALAEWRAGKLNLERFQKAGNDARVREDAAYDLCEALWAAGRAAEARDAARRYLEIEKRAGQETRLERAHRIAR